MEVVSTKENGCARRRHACFPGVRPFSLSPTTSKHLLRRPAKVVADSFHNLVYRVARKTCYEDKLLFRNVYFVATGICRTRLFRISQKPHPIIVYYLAFSV